ncbi:MAG: N-acetyltransferase [Bacteroidales bacterium]|nr:N-acetyltransferase [Bacteroidales bacterium]
MSKKIRFVEIQEKDYTFIKEVYDYYILNSTATFHMSEISLDELKSMILLNHPKYKSYIIKSDNRNCGYCYYGPYKNRPAYDRTAELSVYLLPEFSGKGIGTHAIQHIEKIAGNYKIKVLIAIISGDNLSSIRVFEKSGYEKCAHFKQVGEKFGKILDVVGYQKMLV